MSGKAKSIQVLTMSMIAFTICFMCWMTNGVLVSFLVGRGVFDWSSSRAAWLIGIPTLTGSVTRLPVGILTDKYGDQFAPTAPLLLSVVFAYPVSTADSYPALLSKGCTAVLVCRTLPFWLLTHTRLPIGTEAKTLSPRLTPLRSVRVWRFGLYDFLSFWGGDARVQWPIPYYVNVYAMSVAGLQDPGSQGDRAARGRGGALLVAGRELEHVVSIADHDHSDPSAHEEHPRGSCRRAEAIVLNLQRQAQLDHEVAVHHDGWLVHRVLL